MLKLFMSSPNTDEAKLYFAKMTARYNHDDNADAPLSAAADEGNLEASSTMTRRMIRKSRQRRMESTTIQIIWQLE